MKFQNLKNKLEAENSKRMIIILSYENLNIWL